MTIRGAELLSADLKDCDEIRIGGSHQSPLVPHTHMFRSPGGRVRVRFAFIGLGLELLSAD